MIKAPKEYTTVSMEENRHDSNDRYFKEISRYPLINRQEEIRLAILIANGDTAARDKLIVSNLRLVVKIAHEFRNRGLYLNDIIAYGNTGLIEAVDKFDAKKAIARGNKFSTYAAWWIKKQIRCAIAERGHRALVMIKATKASRAASLGTRREMLRIELGRNPSIEELMEATGRTRRMIQILEEVEQMSFIYLDDENHDRNADGRSDIEFIRRENLEHLKEAMKCLDRRERKIVTMKFCLDDGPECTLGDIGKEVGLSGERVRQIITGSLAKLRDRMSKMESTSI